jgi:hypothetical protein
MPSWIRPSLSALAALLLLTPLRAADLDGSPPEIGNAEAARLYSDANDYVSNVTEGGYSYQYMQFFWKRAESFVERAKRVYPDSPTGQALREGKLKLGPYDLDYFKNRVLAKLEEKRTYTVDGVSCAVFLYTRNINRWDDQRLAVLDGVLEVLSRQKRWGEAEAFQPVLAKYHPFLLRSIFRVAARYDEQNEVTHLLTQTKRADQIAAGFLPLQGEAMALLGKPRVEITRFLQAHPEDEVKLAVLQGMVTREVQIRRTAALKVAPSLTIQRTHYDLRNLTVRDNVDTVVGQFFPAGNPQAQELIYAYHAALGTRPPAEAGQAAQLAYLEYLAAFERFDEVESYGAGLPDSMHAAAELKEIEVYAAGDRLADADRHVAAYTDGDPVRGDLAALAKFRGQIESDVAPLTVHEKTFAELPIKDPCILAQAILEESLRPNRQIRGAAPWDAVVYRFDPGFTNLAAPKSNAVRDAASAINPY